MKKTIKIKIMDYYKNFKKEDLYIYTYLKQHYNIVDDDKPDYIIFGDHGYEHLKYENCIKIYITAENMVPNFNQCDYAISFQNIEFEDRYLRAPNYLTFNYYKKNIELINENNRKNLEFQNKKFCNMVVSNGLNGKRVEFFHELSKYKKVDSGGRILNNVGGPVKSKLEFQKNYKFSFAFENSSSNGYTTEKIIDAFASGGIPIYWGDPKITNIFNEKSFINANNFNNNKELINYIIELDKDDAKYKKMLSEKIFLDKNYINNEYEKMNKFIDNIFNQDIKNAIRRCPENHWVNMEKKYYLLSDKIVKIFSPLLKFKTAIKNKLVK